MSLELVSDPILNTLILEQSKLNPDSDLYIQKTKEIDLYNKLLEIKARLKLVTDKTSNQYKKIEQELYGIERELQKYEEILKENPQRFVIFPIQYDDVWEQYKLAQSAFWTTEEITLTDDLKQWKPIAQNTKQNAELSQLTDNDRFFIKHILAFFASFDGLVNENLAQRFYSEIQIPEARCFYGMQIMMENIHGETYSLFIDSFVDDLDERERMFHAVEHYPSIKKLADWAMSYVNSDLPFNQRLIAFACVEGILFSAAFCAIFWLKKRGLMPGFTFSNELISKDEGLHTDFAYLINKLLRYRADPDQIINIVTQAVALGIEFITESLPCNLIGMNHTEMSKYIEYVGDQLLVELQVDKYWNTPSPFPWMDLISMENQANMFEKRVSGYGRSKFNKNTIKSKSKSKSNTDSQSKATESITILEEF